MMNLSNNLENDKDYKLNRIDYINMLPGNPAMGCRMSLFSVIFKDNKLYKQRNIINISNLRIVSMLPGDRNGLPDAFCFIEFNRGVFL